MNVFGSEYSFTLLYYSGIGTAGHWIKISIISHLLVERMEKCECEVDSEKKKRIEKCIYKFCCIRIEIKGSTDKK